MSNSGMNNKTQMCISESKYSYIHFYITGNMTVLFLYVRTDALHFKSHQHKFLLHVLVNDVSRTRITGHILQQFHHFASFLVIKFFPVSHIYKCYDTFIHIAWESHRIKDGST